MQLSAVIQSDALWLSLDKGDHSWKQSQKMQLNRIQKRIPSGGLNKWVPGLQARLSQVWSAAPPAHKHSWVLTGASSTNKDSKHPPAQPLDAKYLNIDFLQHPNH